MLLFGVKINNKASVLVNKQCAACLRHCHLRALSFIWPFEADVVAKGTRESNRATRVSETVESAWVFSSSSCRLQRLVLTWLSVSSRIHFLKSDHVPKGENGIELTTYPLTLLCQKELVADFAANLLAIYQYFLFCFWVVLLTTCGYTIAEMENANMR